jgi:hypothetical protein
MMNKQKIMFLALFVLYPTLLFSGNDISVDVILSNLKRIYAEAILRMKLGKGLLFFVMIMVPD